MIKSDIFINAIRIKLLVDLSVPKKSNVGQKIFNKKDLGYLLQVVKDKYPIAQDIIIQKVVLDLGKISLQHGAIHLHQRLHSALVKLFMQLEKIARNAPLSTSELVTESAHPGQAALFAQAIACLQPGATKPFFAQSTISADVLYQSLSWAVKKHVAETATHFHELQEKSFPGIKPQRLTPLRLAHLALSYLLTESEGRRWLSQHSLTHEQRDAWAAAIMQREIQPQHFLQLIELTEVLPVTEARLIAGRWIVPLWRYPGVSRVVQQQLGNEVAQQIETYLASLLPQNRSATSSAVVRDAIPQGTSAPVARPGQNITHTLVTTAQRGAQRSRASITRPAHLPGEEDAMAGLPVTNAGVILFWPLFTQWFTALGLMEEKHFISDDARWQAVVAMDWLAWEQEHPDAQRLIINQFLCGLPLSEPPLPLAPLPPELQQATLAWVDAISRQLAAFEKMSLTDIRQLFLQRPGELFADITPAVLNITPQPFDILLTKWPWPLNLAYFPWFDAPLIIEWPGSQPAGTRL